TGPALNAFSIPLTSSLDFRPLSYDFNGDLAINNADITALSNAVLQIVERAMEPFDIDVELASSSTLAAMVTTLNSNDSDAYGSHDAYSLVLDVRSNFYSGGSVGDNTGLNGLAGSGDLFALWGNIQDEAALTFSDNIYDALVATGATP